MPAKNLLTIAPPYEVDQAIRRLGINPRIARLRRNLTIQQAAKEIGTGPRAVMGGETGKLTTGIAVHCALALDL